jgi:predicted transcriptional regulator
MKNLVKAKWMKAISGVMLPEYPEYVLNLAEKGVPVSVIVTRELLEMIKEKCKTELEKSKCYENVCIMVCDEKIGVSFAVTDFFISTRLFLKDGTYDFYKNILSFEKSAVGWGEDMFRYYEKRSERIRLGDL